ncbi:MAG: iron reductase [Cyanothece sp. SIO2G6]|nr:iron reductase [Cyanothece sp. SIO2G6]
MINHHINEGVYMIFRNKVSINFLMAFVLIFLVVSLIASRWSSAPVGNVLALLSVISYVLTLIPGCVKTLVPKIKRHPLVVWLSRHRRYIGVASFCFGAQHGGIIVAQRSLDMLDMHTYRQYLHGSILLGIFALLTMTSNDRCVRWLKKKWKKVQQLTYVIPGILFWHVADNMNTQTWVTPIAGGLICFVIGTLGTRLWIAVIHNQWGHKTKEKPLLEQK